MQQETVMRPGARPVNWVGWGLIGALMAVCGLLGVAALRDQARGGATVIPPAISAGQSDLVSVPPDGTGTRAPASPPTRAAQPLDRPGGVALHLDARAPFVDFSPRQPMFAAD